MARPVFTREILHKRIKPYHTEKYRRDALRGHPLGRLRSSAILIPLLIRDGEVRVLLTKRASHLTQHAGEVCFPGGQMDPGDVTEEDTCLREAEEEIGLKRKDVEIVARLLPIISATKYLIQAVVGIIPATFQPEINTAEVQAVGELPLERFLSLKHSFTFDFMGRTFVSPSFRDTVQGKEFKTEGPTSAYCMSLATILFQKPVDYEISPGSGETLAPDNPFIFNKAQINQFLKHFEPSKI